MKYIVEDGKYICADVTSEHYGRPIRVHKKWKRVITNSLVVIILLGVVKVTSSYNVINYSGIYKIVCKEYTPPFNKGNLINKINQLNPSYKDICVAQCQYESRLGTSSLFKQTNNLFGITVFSLKEKHYTIESDGVSYHFKVYANWMESVDDWYNLVYSHQTDALIHYMGQYYCKDPGYVENLKTIINN